jgi:D-3-phosphoglycerate dehydrogenase
MDRHLGLWNDGAAAGSEGVRASVDMTKKYSFPKEKIRILLLEGIHAAAGERFSQAGYAVESVPSAMSEEQLLDVIPEIHLLGIRSKTRITKKVLDASARLLAIGCYCIGTDQVALKAAAGRGVPVFNAPFSSTRSVAELTLAEVVMLARKAAHRSLQLHDGRWEKSASGAHEVRHKTIGIVGYGHIGPQVGLLAESFGMHVVFYDIAKKLPLGNAESLDSLDALLAVADFVTLHVPDTPLTKGMIGAAQLARMRPGSYLLNLSRGSVVDLTALREALLSGHLAGAAVDVYPEEPKGRTEEFDIPLRGLDNVILTPHVGGSTLEAQRNIGIEVADSLIGFTDAGTTTGAVNFPQVELPVLESGHRVLNIHKNVPGVLRDINRIIADMGANVSAQHLGTLDDVGYLIMDVDAGLSRQVKQRIDALETNIRTRLLF